MQRRRRSFHYVAYTRIIFGNTLFELKFPHTALLQRRLRSPSQRDSSPLKGMFPTFTNAARFLYLAHRMCLWTINNYSLSTGNHATLRTETTVTQLLCLASSSLANHS
jgi:hypothetical protein